MESFEKIGEAELFLDRMSPEHNPRLASMTPKCENYNQFERPRGLKKCPGAGQRSGTAVLARVVGAHPHTVKIHALVFAAQVKSKAFDIQVVVLSAQILISASTTWRSSTACRQTCHSWRRKPERSFCRVWKRAGTTTPLRRWRAFVWVCMAPSMAFRRVATTTSATVEVVKLTVRAKTLAISMIKIIVSWKLVKTAEQKLAALAATVSEDADSMSSGSESSSDSDKE